ncbi:MAG: winged helix-turn-helix domain-containing protein [Pyrinomonadaceae bacterium]
MSEEEQGTKKTLLYFGGFTLNLERRGLYRGPERVRLTSKPLETLIFLLENPGRIVEKQELLDAVWKDTFVTEDTLVHAIREIRRVLGDDKEDPRYIQTVPRQGYRFVGELTAAEPVSVSAAIAQDISVLPVSVTRPGRKIPRWFWVAAAVFALISIPIWFFGWRDESSRTQPPTESRLGGIKKQITTGEFSSSKPAFSSDGKFVLYVSSEEDTRGYGDLFIRQFPEGNAQRITNRINPSGDLPVFTADSSHVVFSLPRFGPDGARHHDLWIVPSFGGPPTRFIEDASGAGFSPDEKWVAYTKQLPSGNALWVSPVGKREEHLEVSDEGYTPRWSPSGEWLTYTTSNPNEGMGAIWICKVSQSSEGSAVMSAQKRITKENEQMYGLTWTADSSSIIFSSKRAGPAQLYKVSLADGSTTPLLVGVGEYNAPSASPDGSVVIFQYFRLINDLKTAALSGECNAKSITFDEFHLWPRISPAGEKIASVIRQVDDAERLVLTDLKTKESSQLSSLAARHPCWLNEENIAFLSPDASKQNTEALVVNILTRETYSLTRFSGKAAWLAIHPDGKRVAVVLKSPDGRERILLRDLSNQVDTTIHEGSEYEYLRWSPDGSKLSWDKPGTSRNAPQVSAGVWMIVMGQSEPRLVVKDGYCPVWSEDGAAVYFGVRQGQQGLWRYDLRQQKEHLVCSWETVFSYDIVSNRLVFAQHKSDSQIHSMSLRP